MNDSQTPGTPTWLRHRNERTALALLLDRGELNRNTLASLSGLSRPTTTSIVSSLEDSGLIEMVGEDSGGKGPNAARYGVKSGRAFGVAVNIDAAGVHATIVNAIGTEFPVTVESLDAIRRGEGPVPEIRRAIDRACAAAEVDPAFVKFVVLGVQGAVDPNTDQIRMVTHLESWPGSGLRSLLENELGLRVTIENDVNLAAIAERAQGTLASTESFALLWLSDGLGLAVDLNGSIYRGAAGVAGEIGPLPTPRSTTALDPQAQTLEQLFGSVALIALAKRNGVQAGSVEELAALPADDPRRVSVWQEFAMRIALGIQPVLAIIDPGAVIIGGPVGVLGGEELAELISGAVRQYSAWGPTIRSSGVSDDPVLSGAKRLLAEQVRQHLLDQVGAA